MTRDEIIDALRYQIITPRVTTMGPCSRYCGSSARGAGVCAMCRTFDLSGHVGVAKASRIAAEFWAEAKTNWAREDEA